MPTDEEILNTGETEARAAAEQASGQPEGQPTGQPDTQTGEVQPTDAAPDAGGQEHTPTNVPLAALEDERRKRQEAENQLLQYQQALLNQQAMRQAIQGPAAQPEEDVLAQIGISADDIYSDDGIRKLGVGIKRLVADQVQQAARAIRAEVQQTTYTDYSDLVGTQGPMGFQPAPPLVRAMKDDPQLQADLLAMTDPAQQQRAAYRAAKMAKQIMDLEAKANGPSRQDIETTVNARTAPMSPAAAGAGGAFSMARTAGEMSDEEFDKMDREAAAGV